MTETIRPADDQPVRGLRDAAGRRVTRAAIDRALNVHQERGLVRDWGYSDRARYLRYIHLTADTLADVGDRDAWWLTTGLASAQLAHQGRLTARAGQAGHLAAAEFEVDEASARVELARLIAARDSDDDETPEAGDDVPGIGSTWQPGQYDQADNVRRLVRYAADNGIIVKPAGMDIGFVLIDDESEPHYFYSVGIGPAVTLESAWLRLRKLGNPDVTGLQAALHVLREAVAYANTALAGLAALLAEHRNGPRGQHLARETPGCPGRVTEYKVQVVADPDGDAEVIHEITVQLGSDPDVPGTGNAAILQAGIEITS